MTNTPTGSNDRLDRIEANLEVVTESLVNLATQANTTDQRLERVSRLVESNRTNLNTILRRLDQVSASIAASNQRTVQLEERFERFIAQAEADRAIMRQILQFLQNQYPGNGSAGRQ